MTCQARQYSDEMHCAACRLRWDVNDPEPPACRTLRLIVAQEKKSPVMRAADNAAKVVAGWSDAKKEYADRVPAYASALAPDPWGRG